MRGVITALLGNRQWTLFTELSPCSEEMLQFSAPMIIFTLQHEGVGKLGTIMTVGISPSEKAEADVRQDEQQD